MPADDKAMTREKKSNATLACEMNERLATITEDFRASFFDTTYNDWYTIELADEQAKKRKAFNIVMALVRVLSYVPTTKHEPYLQIAANLLTKLGYVGYNFGTMECNDSALVDVDCASAYIPHTSTWVMHLRLALDALNVKYVLKHIK